MAVSIPDVIRNTALLVSDDDKDIYVMACKICGAQWPLRDRKLRWSVPTTPELPWLMEHMEEESHQDALMLEKLADLC